MAVCTRWILKLGQATDERQYVRGYNNSFAAPDRTDDIWAAARSLGFITIDDAHKWARLWLPGYAWHVVHVQLAG